jgi:hypothetical protein
MLIYISDFYCDNSGLCPRWEWKARTEKPVFSRNKRATEGSSFYDFRKKVLKEDLQRTAGLGATYYF